MRPNIVNLRQFYTSPLGRKVKRRLRRILRSYWEEEHGLHSVGIGYATPVLPVTSADPTARILALMPTAQGAIYWPVDEANHSVLGDELMPPFQTSSLHRVVVLHLFEYSHAPDELLSVWWQMLAPGGRLLLIVPNRRGLWARFGATPFSTGTPYTLGALKELLRASNFTLRDTRSACYAPPSSHPFWLRIFSPIEWLGAACFPHMGGLFVIEAEKQIYANVRDTAVVAAPSRKWAPATAVGSARNSN